MADPSRYHAGETSLATRPLGSLEQLLWLFDQHYPTHFTVTAEVSGNTSVDDWRKALDRLQERHSSLSSSIEHRAGSVPWFREVSAAPIPLRIVYDDPRKGWQAVVAEELTRPFDSGQAPLIRSILIRSLDYAAFTLVAHHSIADGMSLAYAVRDTLRAVSGDVLEQLPMAPSQDEMLLANGATMSPDVEQEQGLPPPRPQPAIYRQRDTARPHIRSLRLTPALTASLKERARQETTTVHGALCAALLIAGKELLPSWKDGPVRILSPINTRELLGAGESCGDFFSAAISAFEPGPTRFWQLARQAKLDVASGRRMASIGRLALDVQQFVGTAPSVAEASAFKASALAAEGVVTNLGRLSFASRFGHLELKALWGPCILLGFEGDQTIGVATVDGALCLTHTSHSPSDGLLEIMRRVLAEACLPPSHSAASPDSKSLGR